MHGKEFCQGTVKATLELGPGGNGSYSIDGLVLASEFRGNFAAGHVQSSATAAPHGAFIAEANATNLYGSWISFGSRRLFHWDFVRVAPPPPPPPPCADWTAPTACAAGGCLWEGGACRSRITQQVDVFIGGAKAPWGTIYNCFRVPSSVLLPDGDVVIFVESRIGSCGDQACDRENRGQNTEGTEEGRDNKENRKAVKREERRETRDERREKRGKRSA
eukprot:SAG11_NODE_9211_length_933_cov_0.676259_2_plen_218_part_01